MEQLADILRELISNNVQYAHFIIFFALLLAGLNFPISEDAMLFISGILAAKHPEHREQLFIGVFLGAYFSDLIAYWLGRTLGPKLWDWPFFGKRVPRELITKIGLFYKRYGMITIFVGRFIPFGVRNALFITAGLGGWSFTRFSLVDLGACTVSTVFFFFMYYTFGKEIIENVKTGNLVFFTIICFVVFFIVKAMRKKKNISAETETR